MSQGAEVYASDGNGMQPIHYACTNGHSKIAQWLVSQGATVGASATELAQAQGHQRVASLLESKLRSQRQPALHCRRANNQQVAQPAQLSQGRPNRLNELDNKRRVSSLECVKGGARGEPTKRRDRRKRRRRPKAATLWSMHCNSSHFLGVILQVNF